MRYVVKQCESITQDGQPTWAVYDTRTWRGTNHAMISNHGSNKQAAQDWAAIYEAIAEVTGQV